MKAIYIRTSTKEQTPELQLKDIASMVAIKDIPIYTDKQSAWQDHKERTDFNKLKKLITSNRIKDLYVWDLDRIYRDRKKLISFLELCKVYKCKIHSFRQSFLKDINNIPNPWNEIVFDLLINVLGWIAEEESSKKSMRIKNAVVKKEGSQTKSYKGNAWGRKGYTKQTITKVMELYKQGKSIREISKSVKYYDKNRNEKSISVGGVHKIVSLNTTQ